MGAVLSDIAVHDDASISEAREAVRTHAATIGLDALAIERTVAATSELARNQLAHARRGSIAVRAIERGGIAGIEVVALDRGPGLADPRTALAGAPRASGSLGVGLSAAHRQVDELDLDTRAGTGTCVWARTFAAAVARSEVGVIARPHPDETAIGDHAAFVRAGDALMIAIADGLGHGAPARDAADRAIAVALADPAKPLDDLLSRAHAALAGTRGAVMAIARIAGGRVEHAAVGNIASRIVASDGAIRFLAAASGTLGSVLPRRLLVEQFVLDASDLVMLCSDGIMTRVDLSEPGLLRHHPIVVAQHILEHFGRGTDDALVVVAR